MSVITASHTAPQPIPPDPAAVWQQARRILFAVASKVRRVNRQRGHGRGEAEPEELVHDAFIRLMERLEALPNFNPAIGKFTTYVYAPARRRIWLVVRAAFCGLSPEKMHRLDAAKRAPRYHRFDWTLSSMAAPKNTEERDSVRKVEALRRQLPRRDRRLIDLYLQEGGSYAAIARRLHRSPNGVCTRSQRLFRRTAATA